MTRSTKTAAAIIPENPTLDQLREIATGCRACELWRLGTQTVFGEGAAGADVVLVGEQPGDYEDREGRPFVGPAGRLLGKALERVGIDRKDVYVTNVVKHFNWQPMGKRRIHKRPNAEHVRACRPWLETEMHLVRPKVIVCLGATAGQLLLGRSFRIHLQRGQFLDASFPAPVFPTVHPSSILRAPDDESRRVAMKDFVEDLALVAEFARTGSRPQRQR